MTTNTTEREKLYSTAEAAEYLGIVPSVLRYHIYTNRRLVPDLRLGRELGFYKSTLDTYAAQWQSADMTIAEAAAYLGVSVNRLRYHIYNTQIVQPSGIRGKSHTFRKADLDAHAEVIRAPMRAGRQPKRAQPAPSQMAVAAGQ